MKELIKELGYWIEDKLKDLCGEISPDKRLTVIIIILIVGAIANLYFTFYTVYQWGQEDNRRKQLKIEHMKQFQLQKKRDFNYWEQSEDSTLYENQNRIDYE